MRTIAFLGLLGAVASTGWAQASGAKAEVEKKLESQYALTKTTDDKTDIVTAGAVIVLQKDKLVMVTADSAANQCPNVFKDGKLSQNGACKANETLKKIPLFGRSIPGADKVPNTRTFVTGEKFWVTKIDVKDTGKDPSVTFDFFSDAINDVRYKGTLTVQFKKTLPPPDEVLKTVAEVITVAPSEEAKGSNDKPPQQGDQQQQQQQSPAAAAPNNAAPAQPAAEAPPAPVEAPPPAIEAPPPPPADPVTVSIGQTTDQVVAELGQPTKKAKVGTKEIYYYKDMKVVFVAGKVKDVQ